METKKLTLEQRMIFQMYVEAGHHFSDNEGYEIFNDCVKLELRLLSHMSEEEESEYRAILMESYPNSDYDIIPKSKLTHTPFWYRLSNYKFNVVLHLIKKGFDLGFLPKELIKITT